MWEEFSNLWCNLIAPIGMALIVGAEIILGLKEMLPEEEEDA